MLPILHALLGVVAGPLRSRIDLHLENVALRHQRAGYQRSIHRPPIQPPDRILWAWLSRAGCRGREGLISVRPATVRAWQRRRFREHGARLSRNPLGRPAVSPTLRTLIRNPSIANPR